MTSVAATVLLPRLCAVWRVLNPKPTLRAKGWEPGLGTGLGNRAHCRVLEPPLPSSPGPGPLALQLKAAGHCVGAVQAQRGVRADVFAGSGVADVFLSWGQRLKLCFVALARLAVARSRLPSRGHRCRGEDRRRDAVISMIATPAPAARDRLMQSRLGATALTASDDACFGRSTATSQFRIWDRVVVTPGHPATQTMSQSRCRRVRHAMLL
jgi:hypothetical protein